MDRIMKKGFENFISSLLDDMEEIYREPEPEPEYKKEEFVSFIFSFGESFYNPNPYAVYKNQDYIFDALRKQLETIPDTEYWAIRTEGKTICLATPIYIPNGKITVAKCLGIIPEALEEVSGPMSSVFLIDCEKQYLRKEYLKLRGREWLI